MCPYYLDGEQLMTHELRDELGFITLCASPDVEGEAQKHSRLIMRSAWPSAVFKVHGGDPRGSPAGVSEN